jgi:hypothetical protein
MNSLPIFCKYFIFQEYINNTFSRSMAIHKYTFYSYAYTSQRFAFPFKHNDINLQTIINYNVLYFMAS